MPVHCAVAIRLPVRDQPGAGPFDAEKLGLERGARRNGEGNLPGIGQPVR